MRRIAIYVAGIAVLCITASAVRAHEGPPFPLVVDQKSGPYLVSVWTDPDVGTGTFFVILAAAPGTTLPPDNTVEVCVQPADGRLPEACYAGVRQDMRDRAQYCALVEFDRQEMWHVRVKVNGTHEINTEVEATPPGFGAWDLLIYGLPFILFGGLWLIAALRGRSWRLTATREPT